MYAVRRKPWLTHARSPPAKRVSSARKTSDVKTVRFRLRFLSDSALSRTQHIYFGVIAPHIACPTIARSDQALTTLGTHVISSTFQPRLGSLCWTSDLNMWKSIVAFQISTDTLSVKIVGELRGKEVNWGRRCRSVLICVPPSVTTNSLRNQSQPLHSFLLFTLDVTHVTLDGHTFSIGSHRPLPGAASAECSLSDTIVRH